MKIRNASSSKRFELKYEVLETYKFPNKLGKNETVNGRSGKSNAMRRSIPTEPIIDKIFWNVVNYKFPKNIANR